MDFGKIAYVPIPVDIAAEMHRFLDWMAATKAGPLSVIGLPPKHPFIQGVWREMYMKAKIRELYEENQALKAELDQVASRLVQEDHESVAGLAASNETEGKQ
jgi:hypothetical protein